MQIAGGIQQPALNAVSRQNVCDLWSALFDGLYHVDLDGSRACESETCSAVVVNLLANVLFFPNGKV